MGKPSRERDLAGAVLLVLVGLLYMTGVTHLPAKRGAHVGDAVGVQDVSAPLPPPPGLDFRT
jgi:hypothetical protein